MRRALQLAMKRWICLGLLLAVLTTEPASIHNDVMQVCPVGIARRAWGAPLHCRLEAMGRATAAVVRSLVAMSDDL
jgi:hypothetical protein